MAEQRCPRCSRIPWNIQIWELLARFRKSRDKKYQSSWLDGGSLDDIDFALDALRKERLDLLANEHKEDAAGVRGLGCLHPSHVECLVALVQDPCDDSQEETGHERGISFSDQDEADEINQEIKLLVRFQSNSKTATVYFSHHSNFAALEDAAVMGCYLCRTLQAVLRPGSYIGRQHHRFSWNRHDRAALLIYPGHPKQAVVKLLTPSPVPGEIRDEQSWFSFPQPLRRETLDHDLECLVREVIQPWVGNCDSRKGHHQHCRPTTQVDSGSFPTRLIDVGTCPTDNVRLAITTEDISKTAEQPKYLTLSYVWGRSNDTAKTTPQNLQKRREAIDTTSLPRTILDAIRLTRAMKIRYLWVDALCIIQDGRDFYLEAPKMGSYYTNGYCLISATGCPDSSEGLFPDRKIGNYRTKTCTIGYDAQFREFWLLNNPSKIGEFEPTCPTPVMNRAWCLQERLLSPRILHVTPEQVLWQCYSIPGTSECYCNPETQPSKSEIESKIALTAERWGLPIDHPLRSTQKSHWVEFAEEFKKDLPRNHNFLWTNYDGILGKPATDMWLAWTSLVQQYVEMELTNENDRLVAIEGLGRELAQRHEDSYFGGIFLSHLAHGLLWKGEKRPPDSRSTCCPTWSWGMAKWVDFVSLECPLTSNISQDTTFPSSGGMTAMGSRKMISLRFSAPLLTMPNMPLVDTQQLRVSVAWPLRRLTFILHFDEQSLVPGDLSEVNVMLLGYTDGHNALVGLVVRKCVGSYQFLERVGHVEARAKDSDIKGKSLDEFFKAWTENVNLV